MNAVPTCFDLDRLILALADAFDLVGVDKTGHSRRVGLIAARLAEELGWEAAESGRCCAPPCCMIAAFPPPASITT